MASGPAARVGVLGAGSGLMGGVVCGGGLMEGVGGVPGELEAEVGGGPETWKRRGGGLSHALLPTQVGGGGSPARLAARPSPLLPSVLAAPAGTCDRPRPTLSHAVVVPLLPGLLADAPAPSPSL